MKRINIVHIEDFFHPNAGYQINLLAKYQSKIGYNVSIITSEINKCPKYLISFFGSDNINESDLKYEQLYNVKIHRVPIWLFYSGRAIYKRSIFRKINELKPDILYIHGNSSFIGMWVTMRLRKIKCPVIFDNHMLNIASENYFSKIFNFFYKKYFAPKIIKNQLKICRVVNDDFIIKSNGIPEKLAPVIELASDRIHFSPDINLRNKMRQMLCIKNNEFVVIYSGKLDKSKGGLFLANSILEKFKETNKSLVFLIIGNVSKDKYGQEVENIINKSNNRLIRLPTQPYIDLPSYYSVADIAVFPRQCSLSFYDFQSMGIPVVLENISINIDRLKFNNGLLFESDNQVDFREKITYFANLNENELNNYRVNAIKYMDSFGMDYSISVNKLDIILKNEIKKYKKK